MMTLARVLQLGMNKYTALGLTAFVMLQAYWLVRPGTPALDPARAEAAARVGTQIAEALSENAGQSWSSPAGTQGPKYIKVARLAGDPGDHIRARIESALQARTNCIMVADTVAAGLRNEALAKAARLGVLLPVTADAWKTQPIRSPEAALELARESRLDFVVFGEVEDFRALPDGTSVRLKVGVVDAASGVCTFERTFEGRNGAVFASATPASVGEQAARPGLRIMTWLVFVLVLPMCSAGFWKALLERESNGINAACVLFITVLDTLLAWGLIGFDLSTMGRVFALSLAFVVAGTYNFLALNLLEQGRERELYLV